MDTNAPILRVAGLSIRKGPTLVLENTDLTLNSGEYACITGRSGSGKTSLLRTLALLETPAAGRIMITGKDYTVASRGERARARLTLIGYIPQHDNLIPQLTVRENILLPVSIRGEPPEKAEERLEALAGTLRINMLLDRYPYQLSGGQRRRAMIARALIREPKLILADEPLAGLDEHLAGIVLNLFRMEAGRGAAVIHATPTPLDGLPCTSSYRIAGKHLVPA